MVVSGVTRLGSGGALPRRRGVEGRSFGVAAEKTVSVGGPMATGAVSVTSLLALQEAESGMHQDREAKKHGTAIVDELTELQCALLGGDGPDLDRLETLVARPISASDPVLAGLVRAVRLRAGIELARRGRVAAV